MQSKNQNDLKIKIKSHLDQIYKGQKNIVLAEKIITVFFKKQKPIIPDYQMTKWNEEDVILITYANTFINEKKQSLKNLIIFLNRYIKKTFNSIHILPYFPYSSDDGFAVINFNEVNQSFGTWDDIKKIANKYKLMTDVVLNHCSSRSHWFEQYKNNKKPGVNFFIEADNKLNTQKIIRPRTSDLLQPHNTVLGSKYIWSTFGADQPDLNYKNPDVLIEMLKIIRSYIENGTQILRLDAVAFLWKDIKTSCINLPQTHEIIKLIRTLIDHLSEKIYLVTETNIPNRENLSYFGNRNEAHLVYNFAMSPLILYSLLSNTHLAFKEWLKRMPPAMFGTTYFNFLASHDGIGLRPVEKILDENAIKKLVKNTEKVGGKVSYRSEGKISKPYELNISLYDAMRFHLIDGDDGFQYQRFISAHTILLSMEGIPAFYIHSLLGTKNDYKKMKHTSQNRSINRHQWNLKLINEKLNKNTHHRKVFNELSRLIEIRKKQPAFHPNATQFTLELNQQTFGLWRQSLNREQSIFCIHNISNKTCQFNPSNLNIIETDHWYDLISGKPIKNIYKEIKLKPYQSMWVTNK